MKDWNTIENLNKSFKVTLKFKKVIFNKEAQIDWNLLHE